MSQVPLTGEAWSLHTQHNYILRECQIHACFENDGKKCEDCTLEPLNITDVMVQIFGWSKPEIKCCNAEFQHLYYSCNSSALAMELPQSCTQAIDIVHIHISVCIIWLILQKKKFFNSFYICQADLPGNYWIVSNWGNGLLPMVV